MANSIKQKITLTEEEKDKLSKFASTLDKNEMEKGTMASPIATGDLKEIGYTKLTRDVIENYLLMHPLVPRGIEIKANRMTRRGYTIKDGTPEARAYCNEILQNSGGITTLRNLIKDAYGFGAGYLTLVTNKSKDAVLYLSQEHPVYFGISKYPKFYNDKLLADKYKLDPKTKKPAYFSQYAKNQSGEWVEVGQPIEANRVAHLKFDTWGDEPEGISLVQYVHMVIKYLLNIEDSAAQNMYRHGQTQKKLLTKVNSQNKLKEIAKNVENMNAKDVIILPEGSDVENLTPGQTQFTDYHDRFMTLVAIRLGIPKPILTMDGTETNKATLDVQMDDVIADYFADEMIVENMVENMIFKPACKLKFGENFDKIPEFRFNELEENKDKIAARMFQVAQATQMMASAFESLMASGDAELSGKMKETIKNYLDNLKVYPLDEGNSIVVKK